jgi:phosphomannomutase/phosphoglucomutase
MKQEIIENYLNYVAGQIKLQRPLKIVVDAGNSVAGHIAPKLYRALGCEVIELYCELDGRFPHHHPDPSKSANLVDLQKAVLTHQADVGLAFDGDADRLGVVTNQGEIIWPDRQMMLYAKAVLATSPGATILFDVKCSKHLPVVIQRFKGVPFMWKTGHSFIKLKLKEMNAALAGEMSGHIFFNDRWFGFDDGIYTGARLLEILSQCDETSSALFAAFPQSVSTPEMNVTVKESEKFALVAKIIEVGRTIAAEKILLDGLRLEFKNGWALMRASNTSPVLVLRFEADDEVALAYIQKQVKDLLLTVEPTLTISF